GEVGHWRPAALAWRLQDDPPSGPGWTVRGREDAAGWLRAEGRPGLAHVHDRVKATSLVGAGDHDAVDAEFADQPLGHSTQAGHLILARQRLTQVVEQGRGPGLTTRLLATGSLTGGQVARDGRDDQEDQECQPFLGIADRERVAGLDEE